jgi:cytochrome P450
MDIAYEPLRPVGQEAWADPYTLYAELRERAPVYRSPEGVFCLSRYDDVVFALKHPELFSSAAAFEKALLGDSFARPAPRELFEIARFLVRSRINPLRARIRPSENLITTDPPRHEALRSIVNRGFTPRRIEVLEARMREIVAGCMASLHDGEPFDVVRDLAIPLPVTVIAEMLGIDPADMGRFKAWSDAIVAASTGSRRGQLGPLLGAMGELNAYMRPIVRARRERPQDDLLSVIVDPRRDETLEDRAVAGFIVLLLVAGNETTTNLIGNATLALVDHPGELERVREDPSLVPAAVEEVVRFDSPVQFVLRRTTRDVELHGTVIPAESQVAVLLAAANRDPRRFADPDRFDVGRDTRGHVGFGFGVHFCLGASLARLEGRVALEALIPELPRLRRRSRATRYVDSTLVRGPESLVFDVGLARAS